MAAPTHLFKRCCLDWREVLQTWWGKGGLFPLSASAASQLRSIWKTQSQRERERGSRKKQELDGNTLRYSRNQQGATTVTRDDDGQPWLKVQPQSSFQKPTEPQASSQNHISSWLRQSRVKESNGYLDLVPEGWSFNECACVSSACVTLTCT